MNQLARVEEKVDHISSKMDKLCLLIEGDGGNDHPGLKVTVDRLVQTEKRRKFYFGAVFTSLIGLLGEKFMR